MNCWKILGIARTIDKKEIRRAYAKLTKQYHPEDDPEMFQKIRDAYQSAIRYADECTLELEDVDDDVDIEYEYKDAWTFEEEELYDSLSSEQTQMQEAFEEAFQEKSEDEVFVDRSLLWRQQIGIAKRLMKGKNKDSIYEWTQFLSSDEFQKVKYDIHFMRQFYDLCRWSNGSRELFDEILRYYKLSEYEEQLLSQVKGPIPQADGHISSKYRLTMDLNEYLLKYDKDGKWEQLSLAIQKQWKKMTEEWEGGDWFLFIIFSMVAILTVIYFFSIVFGVTDLGYREWMEAFWDR